MSVTPEMARRELARRELMRRGYDVEAMSKKSVQEPEQKAGPEVGRAFPNSDVDTGSFVSNTPRYAAQGARHLAAGIGDIPDIVHLPGNLYEIGKHSIKKALADEGEEVEAPKFSSFGLGDKIAHGIDELTGGYTAPQTEGERAFETVGRAVSSSLGTGGAGALTKVAGKALLKKGLAKTGEAVSKTGKALQMGNLPTAPNIAGHVGSSYAMHEALDREPESYLKALGASVIGGMSGQYSGKLGSKFLKGDLKNQSLRGVGSALGIEPEKIENLKTAGVTPTVGAASKYDTIKHLENASSKLYMAGEPLENIYKNRPGEFLGALDIEKGKKLSKAQIGNKAKEALGNVEEFANAETERLHSKAFEHLGLPDSEELKTMKRVDPRLAAAAEKIRKDKIDIKPTLKKFEEQLDLLETPSEKKEFFKSSAGQYVKRLQKSSTNGEIPFRALDRIRKDLGAKTKAAFGQISDAEKGLLKNLYGNISEDVNSHFEKLGGKALENWQEYKDYYKNYKELDVPHINKLLKEGKKDPSEIFNSFATDLEHGGNRLKQISKGMNPSQSKEVFDSLTLHLGMNAEGEFSPQRWAKKVKHLEPEVQKVYTDLISSNPAVQKKVPALIEAASNIKERSNTSGTAIHNVIYGALSGAGRVLSGDVSALAKPLGGWLTAWGLNKGVFANQNFIDSVYKAQKLKNRVQVPIFIKSLEKIPGMPESVIKQARAAYKESVRLNKADAAIAGVGVKGAAKKAIMSSVVDNSTANRKKKDESIKNHDDWVLSPDGKFYIPSLKSVEEHYAAQ